MNSATPISSFLIRHTGNVHATWYTSDRMELEFRRELPMMRVLELMAELISSVHPVKAHLINGPYPTLSLEFDA